MKPALAQLCQIADTLRIGHAEGLIALSVVAGDGTYLAVNAAMNATVTETQLLERISVSAGGGVGLRRQDWVGQKSMIT